MGATFDSIDDRARRFIEEQHVFFVATAPTGDEGHVNLSPKGYDTFRVLGPNRVAYLDLTGSGAETVAHIRQNGRITLLFCALDGKPNLMRLYGTGTIAEPGDALYDEVAALVPPNRGARAAVVVDVERVSTSCGYSVPLYDYVGERPTLDEWSDRKSDDDLAAYRADKNASSIDGIPSIG